MWEVLVEDGSEGECEEIEKGNWLLKLVVDNYDKVMLKILKDEEVVDKVV